MVRVMFGVGVMFAVGGCGWVSGGVRVSGNYV